MSSSVKAPEHTQERFTAECDTCRTTDRCQWAFDGVTAICVDATACLKRVARQRKGDQYQPVRSRRDLKGDRTQLSDKELDERQQRSDHLAYMIEQSRIRRGRTTSADQGGLVLAATAVEFDPEWADRRLAAAAEEHRLAQTRPDLVAGPRKPRQLTGEYAGGKSGYWQPKASGLKPEIVAWWGSLTPEQQAAAKAKDLQAKGLVGSYEMGRRTLKALRATAS